MMAMQRKSFSFVIVALSLAFSQKVSAEFSTGNTGCECIDTSSVLDLISDCFVESDIIGPNTDITSARGVAVNNVCYPLSYGANHCGTFDMDVDPVCQVANPPSFCSNAWCYINATQCHSSEEYYYKTDLFSEKAYRISSIGADVPSESVSLYYSYSTCNSTAENWRAFATTEPLSERPLTIVIPGIVAGDHYKLDSNGTLVDWDGPDAFDITVPWQGWLVDYMNAIVNEFSNIPAVTFIHRSRGSKTKAPTSSWTQAVTDVEAGIADIGLAAFWITTERLNMVPFTIPIALDPIYLWIKQPQIDEGTVRENVEKLLSPFSTGLWLLLVGSIALYAIISLVLSPERFRVYESKPDDPTHIRFRNNALMMADSLNISFLEFLGGNVDYWTVSGEAQKILNVGFALTVFVSVAAYTANLAAFLTKANSSFYISNMEEAIAQNVPICTWSSLQNDLLGVYPLANWVFFNTDAEIFKGYDKGLCTVIVRGYVEVPGSDVLQDYFCSRDLVHLPVPVMEKPMGFPAGNELVGGLSYWISEASNQGISVDYFMSQQRLQCPLEIQIADGATDDLAQLTPTNMALPLIVYAICVVLAIAWQIGEKYAEKQAEKKSPPQPLEEAVQQQESAARQRESVSNLRRKSVQRLPATTFAGNLEYSSSEFPRLDTGYQHRASLRQVRMESFRNLKTNNWLDDSEQSDRIAKLEQNVQLLLTTQTKFLQSMKLAAPNNDEGNSNLEDL